MKILLVSPKFPDTFWSFKHALKFVPGKETTHPPLGLLTVAAMLPADWEKRVVDLNVNGLKEEDLRWADYVFISAMYAQKASAEEVIEKCRAAGVKTVAGGPYFTSNDDDFERVDHLVLNEAEITLPAFLADLANGRPEHVYTADRFADVRKSPVPAFELLDMDKYTSMSVQYSRGCPFDCDFCDITKLNGRRPRTKSKEQILAELENIYRLGWRAGVFFVDDNFIGNRHELKREILPAIYEWMDEKNHPFSFVTQTTIDIADDDELLDLMYRAGFDVAFIGIETPNEDGLAECGKVPNKGRDMVAAVKKVQGYGFQVQGGFIVGFDSDPPDIFQRQVDFIQESNIVVAMVGLLNALHGTKLYYKLKNENRLSYASTGDNTDFSTNIVPKMPKEKLEEGYKYLVKTIYSPKYYYGRLARYLKDYKVKTNKIRRSRWAYVSAFGKSVLLLGIIGRERYQYWKLFFRTLFARPKSLSLAITFAIYGYHFRKVFERY